MTFVYAVGYFVNQSAQSFSFGVVNVTIRPALILP